MDKCTKNAVRGGLCCKHGRMEGVVEERICGVEGCTNRVLKKKKKRSGGGDMEEEKVREEEEEEFCKRHAVKKVDEDGHVICSERWCRNKVVGEGGSGGGGGGVAAAAHEGGANVSSTCCEKGNEAVPLCMKHCKNTHHLDCGSECKSSVHQHDHEQHDHHHHDGGEKKKAANQKQGGDEHEHHHHKHHHHHDHHDSNRKRAPCGTCNGCKTLPCKKCTNCTSTPKKRCKERACANPIWMDRKEYDDMMEQRKLMKKNGGSVAVEGEEKDGVEGDEEEVDELEETPCHHDHEHHHHHDLEGEKDGNGAAAAKEAVVVPKKPLNAYMRYVAEIRESVKAEFSELTGKELVSACTF